MNTNCSTPPLTPSEALAMAPAVALSVVRDCAVILGTYGLHDCEDELAQACKSLSAVVAENESLREKNRTLTERIELHHDRATRAESENESLRAEMGRVRELEAVWRQLATPDDPQIQSAHDCADDLCAALAPPPQENIR
jgi:FtsZ-binding cell division protein ZapB